MLFSVLQYKNITREMDSETLYTKTSLTVFSLSLLKSIFFFQNMVLVLFFFLEKSVFAIKTYMHIINRYGASYFLCSTGWTLCSATPWLPQGCLHVSSNNDPMVTVYFNCWHLQCHQVESKSISGSFSVLYIQVLLGYRKRWLG